MVREGYWFGLPPLVAGVVLLIFGLLKPSGWAIACAAALIILGLFVFYFFRNPERQIPSDPGVIVSPADGRVVVVKEEEYSGRKGTRISIFLAIWNVHVNRVPAAGRITRMEYRPGKFLAAWDENASLQNEQNVFTQATEHGEIVYKQIAGYVARRVVSWKKTGDAVERGERLGLVRFGSRMDVWLPVEAEVIVRAGQNVSGGSSVLARFPQTVGVAHGAPDHRARAAQKTEEPEGGA